MSNSLDADVLECLRPRPGMNVIVAIGNPLRGDDGAGPYIAAHIQAGERLKVLDAGCNPENIVDEVISLTPAYVLFIDAADFGGMPGQAAVIGKENISGSMVSTHMFPLRVVWEIIERDTEAEIKCVGIQPLDCGYHEGLSQEVQKTAEEVIKKLILFNVS